MATNLASKLQTLNDEQRFSKQDGTFLRDISTADFIWAFHSETQDALLKVILPADATGKQLMDAGGPLWIKSSIDLESVCMKVAMSTFKKTKNPDDVILLYVVLKKTNMLVALYKSVKNVKVAAFLSNDFSTPRWSTAAKKNGYNVLKKGKFEMAAAFLILGGDIATALTVLTKNAKNYQLALMVSRLMEGDRSDSCKNLQNEFVLAPALASGDRFTASMVYWIQEEYESALEVLCPGSPNDKADATSPSFSAAVAWDVLQYISNRPVLRRAGLKPVHYSSMIRIGIAAALEYAEKGQSLLAMQLLNTLTKWDRFTAISRPAININFVVQLMHELAIVSCAQIPIDAMARSTATIKTTAFREVTEPVLPSIRLLSKRFGLSEATVLSAISRQNTAALQFSLDREVIFDPSPGGAAPVQAATPSLAVDGVWEVVEALVDVGSMASVQPVSEDFSQRVDSLYRAVRDMCQGQAAASIPDGVVGSAVLVGRFSIGWHAQDYRSLLSMFYPGQQEDGWNLVDKRIQHVSIGHVLLLMLSKLAFVVEGRLAAPPAGGAADERAMACRTKILRRIWAWFSSVKNALKAGTSGGDGTAAAAASLFPAAPTIPQQQHAASNLWQLLLDDEAASHTVRRLPGLAPVIEQVVSPTGAAPEMIPAELYSAAKDVPFRDFAINALKPTVVVVAASKNVQEINIRAALRRSLGGPQTDAPTTKARALAEQKVVTRDRKCAAIATHPTKGCYVTGTYDGGRLDMWQYGTPSDAAPLSTATVANVDQRVTKLHFNVTGSKLGATDSGGHLSLFSLEQQALRPLMSLQCHTRTATAFAWLNAGSVIATVGTSQNRQNLCIWDTLLPSNKMLIHAEVCHDSGASAVMFSPSHFRLFTGGDKGEIGIFDLRMLQMQRVLDGHSSTIQTMSLSNNSGFLHTGCRDGTIKVWDISAIQEGGSAEPGGPEPGLVADSKAAHVRHTGALGMFSSHTNTSLGISGLYSTDMNSQSISCGADGRLVLWKPMHTASSV